MKTKLLLFCIIINISSIVAQPQWVQFNGATGVGSIKAIGNKVWCSSSSGLSNYDQVSHAITHFKKAKGEAAGTYCGDIVYDSAGNIYVAYSDGISKYDGTNWTHYYTATNGDTLHYPGLTIDKNGKVWGVNEFVFYIDNNGVNAITPHYSINNLLHPGIMGIDCDTSGNVYIATQKYGVMIYDGTNWSAFDTTNSPVFSNYAIAVKHDENGKMWFIYSDNASTPSMHIYSTDGINWNDYISGNIFNGFEPHEIYVDRNDKKYFYEMYNGGYVSFDNTNWSIIDSTSGILSTNGVGAIEIDSSGKIWTNSFITAHQPTQSILSCYDGNTLNEINVAENPFGQLMELFKDNDSNIYARAWRGIYQYKTYGWVDISPPTSIMDRDYIDALFDLNGNLWVVGRTSNFQSVLAKNDQSGWTILNTGMYDIYELAVDNTNNLWIAGSIGISNSPLIKYDGTNLQYFNSMNAPIGSWVSDLNVDVQNNLWFAQYQNSVASVVKYDGISWMVYDSTNSSVNTHGSLKITHSGRIFYTSDNVFEFIGNDFVFDSLINSISSNGINLLNEDALGRLWYAPDMYEGIYIFNDTAVETILHPINSGISSSSIGSLVFSNNQAWMCGSAISVYNPEGIESLEPGQNKFISGTVYFDNDTNGVYDANEFGTATQKILILPDNTNIYSNSTGNYKFRRESVPYQINMIPNASWYITSDSTSYHCVADTINVDSLDFGIYNPNPERELEVDITAPRARCSLNGLLHVSLKNKGSLVDSGIMQLTIDSSVLANLFYPTPDSIVANNYFYSYHSLHPFQVFDFWINISVPNVTGLNINYRCNVLGSQGTTAFDTVSQTITCSFDPNEKVATPEGVQQQHYTLIGDSIEYIIYFQNTGTDTAFKVIIFDSLDISLIDINSFEFISSSSPCFVSLNQNGVATFTFDPISLPHKAVNEPSSQGYAKYRIKPKTNASPYSVLNNKAYILFDFNPAIITNQTTNTLVHSIPVSVNEIGRNENLMIFPNPSSGKIYINTTMQNYTLEIYNAVGERVLYSTCNSNCEIDVSEFSTGVYFVIATDKANSLRKRFIKIQD